MSNFDRELEDALRSIKEQHVSEIEPEVPKARLRLHQRLVAKRRLYLGGGLAAAAATLAAAVFVVSVAPDAERELTQPPASESGLPSPEASPTETGLPPERCASRLAFEPTFLPRGMTPDAEVGSGGQRGVPLEAQQPKALVHYVKGETATGAVEGFIDVHTEQTGFAPPEAVQIDVLGTPALLGDIEDGYWVGAIAADGCSYELTAYGIEKGQVQRFAEGLVPRGQANLAYDAFTIWPDTTPEDAYENCSKVDDHFSAFRRTARTAAEHFAISELRWPNPSIEEGSNDLGLGYQSLRAARDNRSDSPYVDLQMREVAKGCWSLSHVSTGLETNESFLSVSKRGGFVEVHFDLEERSGGHETAAIEMNVMFRQSRGTTVLSVPEFETNGGINYDNGARWTKSGSLLILLLDSDAQVVGAIGMPLPSGDFAAG